MSEKLSHGDVCRNAFGSPARYLGDGLCLWICAMDNDLSISRAVEPKGGEDALPLPTDRELMAAMRGLRYGK